MSNPQTDTLDYTLIIPLAIRELTIDVFGKRIKVTEKLFKDPKPIQDARQKLFEGRAKVQAMLDRRESGEQPATDADADVVAAEEKVASKDVLVQFDMALEGDQRLAVCRSFCDSIIATSLVDGSGVPMPLEPDALYASQVPERLLSMILDHCAKTPYVSKK